MTSISRTASSLYDWRLGWLFGHRFLRLTHIGRRTGTRYQTMLEVIARDSSSGEVLVLAGFGRSADWYRNLQAGPATEVAVSGTRFQPVSRTLDPGEAASVLAQYEKRNHWLSPIIRRLLSWLVGWDYDGSPEARQRLANQLPVVGFRPSSGGRPSRLQESHLPPARDQ